MGPRGQEVAVIEPALMKALSDPAFYPHRPASVEVRQTHISVLTLAGPLVYKIKKPVDFGFCDFTTLEKRRLRAPVEWLAETLVIVETDRSLASCTRRLTERLRFRPAPLAVNPSTPPP